MIRRRTPTREAVALQLCALDVQSNVVLSARHPNDLEWEFKKLNDRAVLRTDFAYLIEQLRSKVGTPSHFPANDVRVGN